MQTLGPGIRAQVLGFEEEDEDDDDDDEEEEEEGLFKANAVGGSGACWPLVHESEERHKINTTASL